MKQKYSDLPTDYIMEKYGDEYQQVPAKELRADPEFQARLQGFDSVFDHLNHQARLQGFDSHTDYMREEELRDKQEYQKELKSMGKISPLCGCIDREDLTNLMSIVKADIGKLRIQKLDNESQIIELEERISSESKPDSYSLNFLKSCQDRIPNMNEKLNKLNYLKLKLKATPDCGE